MMRVDMAKLTLRLPHTSSLKDKRRILKSFITKSQHDFRVAIAEVDKHDNFREAVLGISLVSNDLTHNENVLNCLVERLEAQSDIILEDQQRDFMQL